MSPLLSFLGRRTIDEKVYRIIQEKKNIANAVTGSTEDIEENIVDMVARIFDIDYDEEDINRIECKI